MKLFYVLALTWLSFAANGQMATSLPSNVRATNTLDGLKDGGLTNSEILYGMPMAPGDIIGDEFLNENWDKSEVSMKDSDKKIQDFPCRYNLATNELFFQTQTGEVRALKGSKVKSFSLTDGKTGKVSEFVSAGKFLEDGAPLDGFVEVLVDGKSGLYKRYQINVIKPNYRQEFDMGSRDTKLVKKSTYFRADGINLVKLNVKSKKKFPRAFGDQQSKVQMYVNASESFDPGNEFQLMELFRFLNQ
jgi:hypothetical protein